MTHLREGTHWGIVVSTKDPERRDRVRARVPDVLGDQVSDWMEPDSMVVSTLKAGDKIWVRFSDGDTRHGVYHIPWHKKRGIIRSTTANLDMRNPTGDAMVSGSASSVKLMIGKVHCLGKDGGTGYVACVASAFEVGSSQALKTDIGALDFDPVSVVETAPAKRWRYRPEFAGDGREHVGPLAEDLPDLLRNGETVNLADMVGVLWAAVQQLSARVRDLEQQIPGS